MLVSLTIKDVVIIDFLSLDFADGLTVFTGETGAGKSILLDALTLALGGRSDVALVRKGAKELVVTASFSVDACPLLEEHGILPEDGILMLKRVVGQDGKSKAFINDNPVSISLLKQLGDGLVEIHGQFANHDLLNPAVHIDLLDQYGGLIPLRDKVSGLYADWRNLTAFKEKAAAAIDKARADEEFLNHAVKELTAFELKPGEEDELDNRRIVLMHAEKTAKTVNEAHLLLDGGNLVGKINSAYKMLNLLPDEAKKPFDPVLEMLDKTAIELKEAIDTLSNIGYSIGTDENELIAVEDRLYTMRDLARKYKTDCDGLVQVLSDFVAALTSLSTGEDELLRLKKDEAKARLDFMEAASLLHAGRVKAAEGFDKVVTAELVPLKLDKAVFTTDVVKLDEPEWNGKGISRVIFSAATNKGMDKGPIHKIASGGELARFMLALKVNLAKTSGNKTMIFDEVDQGIGGSTAAAVGERLSKLAVDHRQVLVVTHSPQVAASGRHHYTVSKAEKGGAVTAGVAPLTTKTARIEEIARMLSGAAITDEARSAAKTLLGF